MRFKQEKDDVLANLARQQQKRRGGKGQPDPVTLPQLSFEPTSWSFKRGCIHLLRKFTEASTGAHTSTLGPPTAPSITSESAHKVSEKSVGGGFELLVEDSDFSAPPADPHLDDAHSSSPSAHGLDSSHQTNRAGCAALVYRLRSFFFLRFEDDCQEELFQKEQWYQAKPMLGCLSIFLVINLILYLAINLSLEGFDIHSTISQVCYYGLAPALTVPLPFLVAFDVPPKFYWTFQIYFGCSIWLWGLTEIIESRLCHFWPAHHQCSKDFLAMMFYLTAFPNCALMVWANRLVTTIFAVASLVLQGAFILGVDGAFARVTTIYVAYTIFYILLQYSLENRDRRIFLLNARLKSACRAQQKAQMKESQAAASKRRFISYIFHEVRVPLNTAVLAFQNLSANYAFKTTDPDNLVEIHALELSHSLMQKVLNDVLDLNRIDSGKLELTDKPFSLHRDVRATLSSAKALTTAKGLELKVDLDLAIDQLQQSNSQDGLWVIGDPMRLRQILNNLLSNSMKFTSAGHIAVSTKLIRILRDPEEEDKELFTTPSPQQMEEGFSVSTEKTLGEDLSTPGQQNRVVIRFSVEDSGSGISHAEIQSQKLFKPFAQTSIGMAGKGSGLGLAIVRQIVKLSGGRLGLDSTPGVGSTFWFELALKVATDPEISQAAGVSNRKPKEREVFLRPSFDRLLSLNTLLNSPQVGPRTAALAQRNTPGEPAAAAEVSSNTPTRPQYTTKHERSSSLDTIDDDPLRVLVVDDDNLTRRLAGRMLSRLGCDVTTANDGQEALDLLFGEPCPQAPVGGSPNFFDCIFLDNQMPHRTGLEVVRSLRDEARSDLVVGCSGNALAEDQNAFVGAGADEVLTKPVMQADLIRILRIARQRRNQATLDLNT